MNEKKQIRKESGSVDSDSKLTAFLYLLMRDELPLGVVESLIKQVEKSEDTVKFNNGWLAKYSEYITKRLK